VKKILIVAPHPDDETLGCGGSILKFKKNGYKVFWLIVTSSSKKSGFQKKFIESRKKEINKVSKFYKFDEVISLNFPSLLLDDLPFLKIVTRFNNVIKRLKPSIIFTPFISDVHLDHFYCTKAVMACTKSFRNNNIKEIVMYETVSETNFNFLNKEQFNPNLFIDITSFLNGKITALEIYKSEIAKHPFPRNKKNIQTLATLRGSQSGYHYAEAFQSVFRRK
jgi:LmbE family N-acetylglucosaminyl deacetylase|tara:strand:+ start:1885 stop:2550 length:666 start_codon:yes stop_codon:yes gene_type:complete